MAAWCVSCRSPVRFSASPPPAPVLQLLILDAQSLLIFSRRFLCAAPQACLGTSQHLKSKFGEGYLLEIKSPVASQEPILKAFVADLVPEAVLHESHGGHVKYTLPRVSRASSPWLPSPPPIPVSPRRHLPTPGICSSSYSPGCLLCVGRWLCRASACLRCSVPSRLERQSCRCPTTPSPKPPWRRCS